MFMTNVDKYEDNRTSVRIQIFAIFHLQPIKLFCLELNNSYVTAKQMKCPVSGLLQRFSMFNMLCHLDA